MTFAYSEYLIHNLMLPVFAILFAAVPLVRGVSRLLSQAAHGEKVGFGDYRMWILLVLLVVVIIILGHLLLSGGGLHLIYERPGDTVTVEGTIEDIRARGALESPRYAVSGENSYGYEFTVGDVTCVGMARGSLEVGDTVTVTYLPHSALVLAIGETAP